MFIPINPWRHYMAREEVPEINYSHINGTVLLVIYTILNYILYVAAYYLPQEWNCRYVIFGISVFISILGIVFWAIEIKQFVRNNKNYERVCSMTIDTKYKIGDEV
jgi:hypothetical protein